MSQNGFVNFGADIGNEEAPSTLPGKVEIDSKTHTSHEEVKPLDSQDAKLVNGASECAVDLSLAENTFTQEQNSAADIRGNGWLDDIPSSTNSFENRNVKQGNQGQEGSDQLTRQEDNAMVKKLVIYLNTVADQEGRIGKNDFLKALGYEHPYMADRFFAMFDKLKLGYVEKNVLLDGIADLTGDSALHKLKFLFGMLDEDESGYLEAEKLRTLLCSCMKENSISLSEEDIDDLTVALLESAGKGKEGAISFDELVQLLETRPDIMDNMTFSMAHWLLPRKDLNSKPSHSASMFRFCSKRYIQNNVPYVVFIAVYILVNIGLFTLSVVRYRSFNWCVMIARGCGMCLNFNAAFVLVPMLRYTLTWLRTTRCAKIVPLDDSVFIHKMAGIVIFIQSVIHTVAHLGNLVYVVSDDTPNNGTEKLTYVEYLFTMKSKVGYVGPGFGYLSGVIALLVLVAMVICSSSYVRRKGHFQVFYWTHKLYIVFWVFVILHGPIFWYFFLLPGIVYIIEVVTHNPLTRLMIYGRTYITKFQLLPSRVTHLEIARPSGFKYKPGDYIFINIPSIAPSEWHPFTISSAPEMSDSIWLHVRSLGNWTNRVYDYFGTLSGSGLGANSERSRAKSGTVELKSVCQNGRSGLRESKLRFARRKPVQCKVLLLIDGPYGTPNRDIFDTEHAVLVATGIGVTPFASILQSIMHRYKASKHVCPECEYRWYDGIPKAVLKLRKVDFIWINRDQRCFEWFVALLEKLEMEQAEMGTFETFLDMQMYMTSASSRNDMKFIGLQLAMELLHEKKQRDLVTGLRTRTQPGRPDWEQVFQQIESNKKGQVKMFFCGAPTTGNFLEQKCRKYKFAFASHNF